MMQGAKCIARCFFGPSPIRSALVVFVVAGRDTKVVVARSEEHTSELQSLMRISYAVFCLKKKKKLNTQINQLQHHIHSMSHIKLMILTTRLIYNISITI